MRRSITAIAALTVLISLSLAGAASTAEHRTFKIRQEAPVLVTVDVGDAGSSHGDILAFEAKLTTDGGGAGTLRGMLTTVDIPDGDDLFEDRVGQLVFDMGDGGMLIVAGTSVYPDKSVEMAANAPQIRAVIGGTGAYIGARGQVTTVRNADGSYEHSFELVE
jgi:hypothetical protein